MIIRRIECPDCKNNPDYWTWCPRCLGNRFVELDPLPVNWLAKAKEILSRPYWFLRWIWEELGVVKGRTWTRFSLTTGECIRIALGIFAGALAVGLFVFLALLLDGPH